MANWAYVEDGEVKELHDNLPKNWKNISGLDKAKYDLDFLKTLGWYTVTKQYQQYDSSAFDIHSYSHNYDGEKVIESLKLVQKVSVVKEPFEELKYNFLIKLRAERNKRLAETDWTQFTDVVLPNKESWAVYRQKLRDITAIYNQNDVVHIENVEWPAP